MRGLSWSAVRPERLGRDRLAGSGRWGGFHVQGETWPLTRLERTNEGCRLDLLGRLGGGSRWRVST